MHITITGNLGSGKSTVCKILRDQHGFEIYSTGTVQRELAKEFNLTTLEMNQLMCSDPKYDNMIDDATARISRENRHKNIIFDSRLAWHFVEQSFKVFLSVSLDVAAERVMNDSRGEVEKYTSLEEAKKLLAARAETEDKRYKELYSLDYFNFSNYNLVIDSTCTTPENIVSVILEEAKKFEAIMKEKDVFEPGNQGVNTILLSPLSLYPGEITKEEKEQAADLVKLRKENPEKRKKEILVKKIKNELNIIEGKEDVIAAVIAEESFVPVILK
jgi:cytidylate kinase